MRRAGLLAVGVLTVLIVVAPWLARRTSSVTQRDVLILDRAHRAQQRLAAAAGAPAAELAELELADRSLTEPVLRAAKVQLTVRGRCWTLTAADHRRQGCQR